MTITVPEPRTDSRRRLPVVAGARLTPNEMQELRNAAESNGESVSGFVRALILDAIRAPRMAS